MVAESSLVPVVHFADSIRVRMEADHLAQFSQVAYQPNAPAPEAQPVSFAEAIPLKSFPWTLG
jgi:hypothetical protein